MTLRTDHSLIAKWIKDNTRVLDLGCGDGALLAGLQKKQNVTGYGVEIDEDNIVKCIQSGVNVIQTDLDAGLSQFENNTFDYVIMTQTLQAIYYPEKLLTERLKYTNKEVAEYVAVASYRNYLEYMNTGDAKLHLIDFPLFEEIINNNRLLHMEDGTIHFKFEEALNNEKTNGN
mgnify:CR=1 FL=1